MTEEVTLVDENTEDNGGQKSTSSLDVKIERKGDDGVKPEIL